MPFPHFDQIPKQICMHPFRNRQVRSMAKKLH